MNLVKKYEDISKPVKEYVEAHINEKIFVRDIAGALGMNPCYLNASFREVMGKNVSGYIRKRKIDEAIGLLKANENSLSDIWTALGYCDQSHFHKHFKQETGVTPNQYRTEILGMNI